MEQSPSFPPDDIVYGIFQSLPVKSLLRFRSVSKYWRDAVDSVSFANGHLLNLYSGKEQPEVLLRPCKYANDFKGLYSVACDENGMTGQESKYPNPLLKCWSSCHHRKCSSDCCVPVNNFYLPVAHVSHGLLVMRNKRGSAKEAYVCNPLRGEVLELPPPLDDRVPYKGSYGLGFDSATKTYKIIHVYLERNHYKGPIAEIYTLGKSSWRRLEKNPFYFTGSKVESAYGDIHWIRRKKRRESTSNDLLTIVSFDFKTEDFKSAPPPTIFRTYSKAIKLINLRGSLAIVRYSDADCGVYVIWVMKDYANNVWAEEYRGIHLGFPQNLRFWVTVEGSSFRWRRHNKWIIMEDQKTSVSLDGLRGRPENFGVFTWEHSFAQELRRVGCRRRELWMHPSSRG